MGENMKLKTKLKIILPATAVVVLSILGVYAFNSGGTADIVQNSDSVRVVHEGVIEADVNKLSKESDVIVIGTVTGTAPKGDIKLVQGEVVIPLTSVTVSIEKELTGNYQGNDIQVTIVGDSKNYVVFEEAELKIGEKVLLFLAHTDTSTIYGDAYVPKGGFQAKFSIDENGIAHNPKHGDIPLAELESKIVVARATR